MRMQTKNEKFQYRITIRTNMKYSKASALQNWSHTGRAIVLLSNNGTDVNYDNDRKIYYKLIWLKKK